MSKTKEALKMAREAMDTLYATLNPETVLAKDLKRRADAIREALAEQEQEQEPVTGLRCKIVENCKSCQHSVGRQSCSLAKRDFDSLVRSTTPPKWCPLPIYTHPAPANQPSVPDKLTVSMAPTSQYAQGWNDCVDAMLAAAPEAPAWQELTLEEKKALVCELFFTGPNREHPVRHDNLFRSSDTPSDVWGRDLIELIDRSTAALRAKNGATK